MKMYTSLSMENVYDEARNFLISQITNKVPDQDAESLLVHYIDKSHSSLPLDGVYLSLLESAQNANMKSSVIGGSIGGVEKLGVILFDFNPQKVVDHYGTDSNRVLSDIEDQLKPSGQIRKTPRSIWPIYCVTILSSANFLTQFSSGSDFYDWANHFYQDKRSMEALPIIIEKKIHGIGYPLACDFLKELGFVNYGKPDVHIRDIFAGLGLCQQGSSDDDIQKIFGKIAEAKGVSAYNVDKLFWLIGSGFFYEHQAVGQNGKIGSMKKPFIEYMNCK